MIDNYDSFTFNLVQYFGELTKEEMKVFRNDRITVDAIGELKPSAIVISPGPCTPREAGISVECVTRFGSRIPVLGVCLGHQSIGFAYGGEVVRAPYLMHGKVSAIQHVGTHLYRGIRSPFTATRYHSLIIKRETCPSCLVIDAQSEDGLIMGVHHAEHPVYGVQFHPESILTDNGKILLSNFLELAAAFNRRERQSA